MSKLNDEIFSAIKVNYWDDFNFSTATLSNICRQLAFAEGGICWFFISQSCDTNITSNVSNIFLWLVVFFILDASQYLLSSIISFIAACYFEYQNDRKTINNARDVDRTHWMNIPSHLIFLIKLTPLTYSSYLLINNLIMNTLQ